MLLFASCGLFQLIELHQVAAKKWNLSTGKDPEVVLQLGDVWRFGKQLRFSN